MMQSMTHERTISDARRKMEGEIYAAVDQAWADFTEENPGVIVDDIFVEMMDDGEYESRPVNVVVFVTVK